MENQKQFEIRDLRKKDKFMMDDSYLNGFAKKCGVYASAVYMSLCRHANKEQKSWPSLSKIAEEHNISIKQAGRAVKILENYNIIIKERLGKKLNNRYYLIDKSEWTNSPISERTDSPIPMDSQSDHLGTDSPIHSKETHIKETHSKDCGTSPAETKDEIAELIYEFREVNPSYKNYFNNTTQRAAARRLIEIHGLEKLKEVIAILPQTNAMPYAPFIATPVQLENKFAELIAFCQREKIKKASAAPAIAKIR